jgi:hypothetical protein
MTGLAWRGDGIGALLTTRRSLATLAVVLLILVAGVVLLYVTRAQVPPTTAVSTPTVTATATSAPSPTAVPTAASQVGAITGRFGYGSDFIPPVTVYAISTTDPRVWYSVSYAGVGNPPRPTPQPGTSGDTYTITGVAPSTYWVVAYRNDGQRPDPGLYSRVNECFRMTPSGPCPDGTLVPATVTSGQTTSGIDILTWGYPPPVSPSPTIPPRPTSG